MPTTPKSVTEAELCAPCRAGNHVDHVDSGGRCKNDNKFNADCRCAWRPEEETHVKSAVPLAELINYEIDGVNWKLKLKLT